MSVFSELLQLGDGVSLEFPCWTVSCTAALAIGLVVVFKWRGFRSGSDRKQRKETAKKISNRCETRMANMEAVRALDGPPKNVVRLLEGRKSEEILDLLRKGEVSCSDVLRYFQKRALEATDVTNCVTEFLLEAEEWARELDQLPPEKRGPLHGLPVSVKENIDVAGYDSTFGVGKRLECPAVRDALLVHAARSLGVVPFCKTNVPQTTLSFGCGNPVYGLTVNPHDADRTCGGSSGGEGALLAAGGSCLGLGTDVGGSVRIPAHFSGCVGFKPTLARLSKKGVQRITPGAVGVSGGVGVMGTTSRITAEFLRALWSTELMHDQDPTTCPAPFSLKKFSAAAGLTIGYYTDDGWFPPSPATRRAVEVAKEALKRCGHALVPLNMSDFGPRLMTCYFDCVMADDFVNFRKALKNEEVDASLSSNCFAANLGRRCRIFVGSVTSLFSPTVGKILRRGARTSAELGVSVYSRQLLHQALLEMWEQHGVDAVLCPVSAIYAVPHRLISTLIGAQSYCAVYNLLDFPAGVVPVTKVSREDDLALDKYGREEGSRDYLFRLASEGLRGGVGLPVGVQVVGRPYDDELVLSVMCQLEKALTPLAEKTVVPFRERVEE